MLIKARDLRANIAEMGFEKGVVHTLELALEEFSTQRQNLRDAAELIQMLCENLEQYLRISSSLQEQVKQLKRNQQEGDVHGERN